MDPAKPKPCAPPARLASKDKLRRPAAGDAAHDRPWSVPPRHQFSRVRGDRDRRRRRDRRHARTPLSTVTNSVPPPRSCWSSSPSSCWSNIRPASSGAGRVMASPTTEPKIWHRRDAGPACDWAAWLTPRLVRLSVPLISEKTIWAFVTDAPEQAADLVGRWCRRTGIPFLRLAAAVGHAQHRHVRHAELDRVGGARGLLAARNTTPSVTSYGPSP